MMTLVVPSPTSSSWVLESSIMLFAAGWATSISRRIALPSFVSLSGARVSLPKPAPSRPVHPEIWNQTHKMPPMAVSSARIEGEVSKGVPSTAIYLRATRRHRSRMRSHGAIVGTALTVKDHLEHGARTCGR